jgi:hypothetical protein
VLLLDILFDDANRCTTPLLEEAKYEGDYNIFFQTRFFKFGLSLYDLGMERLQAFKYELQPSGEQAHAMRRFVFNPRFQKKGMDDSFRYPQGCRLDQANSHVFLPKLGWIRYHNSRGILGMVNNITVSVNSSKWFASIQTKHEIEPPVPLVTNIVGIDMGITRFATSSRSIVSENIKSGLPSVSGLCHARGNSAITEIQVGMVRCWQFPHATLAKLVRLVVMYRQRIVKHKASSRV